MSSKVAIVTGASAGIGAAIAKLLVNNGYKVVAVARRVEKIEALAQELHKAPGKLYPLKIDVTNECEMKHAFAWTDKNVGPLNLLVNNAGTARPTNIINGSTADWKMVLDTNVMGLTIGCREGVSMMVKNKIDDGIIININSIAGHFVPPILLQNVYPASKHAVTAITETLRQELIQMGSGIRLTSISPGYVQTEIVKINGFLNFEEIARIEKDVPRLQAEDVAQAVSYIISTPSHVQITELTIRPVGEPV